MQICIENKYKTENKESTAEDKQTKGGTTIPAPPPTCVLRGHVEAVSVIRFSTDGKLLFSGSTNGELRAWDISTRRTVTVQPSAHQRGVLNIIPISTTQVITQGKDGFLRWWDLTQGNSQCTASLQTCCCSFGRSCFLPDLSCVASPTKDPSKVALFDIRTGSIVRYFNTSNQQQQKSGMAMALSSFSPSNSMSGGIKAIEKDDTCYCLSKQTYLAGVFEDGKLYIWDISKGEEPIIKESLHCEPATCLEFCGSRGASGSASLDIPVFDINSTVSPPSCNVNARLKIASGICGVNDLRVRHLDCKIFSTAGWDHRVRVWAWHNPRPLAVLKFHVASVTSVDFSPVERSLLASASQDTRIALWNIY